MRKIRSSGDVLKKVFSYVEAKIVPGISTLELDRYVEKIICESDAVPAFKGYKGFPASICASVNEVVVHGIPSDEVVLREGDIISVDVGAKKMGFLLTRRGHFQWARYLLRRRDL